jgi:vacuolar-type H+-ATPase subunit F/Vma7
LSVIAIGASPSIDALRLLGFEIFKVAGKPSKTEEDEILSKILESKVALIEGEIYVIIADRLRQAMGYLKEPPLLVVIPSLEKTATHRLEELYSKLSMAVGVRLRWG